MWVFSVMIEARELNVFKQLLLARQKRLLALVEPSVEESLTSQGVTPSDQQAQLEWSQINKALARIESGTYGDCVVCGKTIDRARLKAYPHSPFCCGCANP